ESMTVSSISRSDGGMSIACSRYFRTHRYSAARVSAFVPTHSNGLSRLTPRSVNKSADAPSQAKRSSPKMASICSLLKNGYSARKTNMHFGQRPHQELVRMPRLQLRKSGKYCG